MRIYCDTNTLQDNSRTEPVEQRAVETLVTAHEKGVVVLCISNIGHREAMQTGDSIRRQWLVGQAEQRTRVQHNERLLGFHVNDMASRGFISCPIMSDVQDDGLCLELEQRGLDRADAQHIVQAVCNECDVFLTRDRRTIVDRYREWLEARFPKLQVRLPSELVAELRHEGLL